MGWIYFQELVESELLSNLGCEQSPIASVTDTHKAYYCLECDQAILIKPRSGTMSQPSGPICCPESTSYSGDFLARISVLQGLEKVWQESEVVFSSKSSDLPESADQGSFSLRTSLPSEPVEGKQWLKNWPRSGMTVGGRLYRPRQLEPRTSETGGSYWLTPRATDTGSGENQETFLKRMGDRTDRCAQSLPAQVKNPKTWPRTKEIGGSYWRTPNANDATRGPMSLETALNGGHQLALVTQVRHPELWPTPQAGDSKACLTPAAQDAKNSTLPPSQAERDTVPGALIRSGIQPGGQLSPMWVEWLMGYRIGWTELDALEIAWFRSKSGKHSKSSRGSNNG